VTQKDHTKIVRALATESRLRNHCYQTKY